ncbi:uncharacterized protein [Montipora foliosa]|uniref:uncharacterized protein n=1 Tax=Montipora foliosa TaxID=591990 RepID=UPI0035F11C49
MTPGRTRTVVSLRQNLKGPVPEEVEAGVVEDGTEEAAAGVVAVLAGEKRVEEVSAGVGGEGAEEEMTAGAVMEDVAEEATEEGAGETEAEETETEEAASLSLEETISGCGEPFLA